MSEQLDALSSEDSAEFKKLVLQRMAEYTQSFISCVWKISDDLAGSPHGTGNFLKYADASLLLTAGHVIQRWATKQLGAEGMYLTHSYKDGEEPVSLTKEMKYTPPPPPLEDLGYALIEPDILNCSNKDWLSIANFATPSTPTENEYVFIHGFPDKAYFWPASDDQAAMNIARSLAVLTTVSQCNIRWFDESLHIAVHYPIEGYWDVQTGQPIAMVEPPGMSGSLMWRLNLPHDISSWEPEMARVIAVTTNWGIHNKVVMGTRAEVVLEFLSRNLKPPEVTLPEQ